RRWTASSADLPEPALVEINWSVVAVNPGGQGVTGRLHVNGEVVDSAAIAGNDTTGVNKALFRIIEAGDIVDVACTPIGANGNTADGADG
ncbi:MAG: hypothetical protein GWO24_14300, partial [Akkermansiaceae bacterium]|nr:hypothetical protein [Akkermansiaceae bacterium]